MIQASGQKRVRTTTVNLTEGRILRSALLTALQNAHGSTVKLADFLFPLGTTREGQKFGAFSGRLVSDEADDTAVTIDGVYLVFADADGDDFELRKVASGTATIGSKAGVAGSALTSDSQRYADTLALTATDYGTALFAEAGDELRVLNPGSNGIAEFRLPWCDGAIGAITETAAGAHYVVGQGRSV